MAPEPKPLTPEVQKAVDEHNAATAKAAARTALEAYLEAPAVAYVGGDDDAFLIDMSNAISSKRIADALERLADNYGKPVQTQKAETDDKPG